MGLNERHRVAREHGTRLGDEHVHLAVHLLNLTVEDYVAGHRVTDSPGHVSTRFGHFLVGLEV